jgi:hypothetical protein
LSALILLQLLDDIGLLFHKAAKLAHLLLQQLYLIEQWLIGSASRKVFLPCPGPKILFLTRAYVEGACGFRTRVVRVSIAKIGAAGIQFCSGPKQRVFNWYSSVCLPAKQQQSKSGAATSYAAPNP